MPRKSDKSLKFSYHKTEEERRREKRAKGETVPQRKKPSFPGFKFPMGAFLVTDDKGNVYFGKIDPVTKQILSICMIENTEKAIA